MRIALFECTLKPHCWFLILVASTVCGLLTFDNVAYGQEVRNAIRDYRDDRVFNYQPSDPQDRGKLFNVHTKHYGKFYNCDSQEDKRNSPYICWKPHYENDFPNRIGFCENLRRDITEIKQRISDGAGNCPSSCNCKQCRLRQGRQTCQQQHQAYPSDCPCVQCAMSNNGPQISPSGSTEVFDADLKTASSQQTKPSCNCTSCRLSSSSNQAGRIGINNSPPVLPESVSIHAPNPNSMVAQKTVAQKTVAQKTVAQNYPKKTYGLMSGKIFQPVSTAQPISAAQPSTLEQTSLGQAEAPPRLPFESVEQQEVIETQTTPSPNRANLAARSKPRTIEQPLKTGPTTSPPAQPKSPVGPRVVERTEFWNQFKGNQFKVF